MCVARGDVLPDWARLRDNGAEQQRQLSSKKSLFMLLIYSTTERLRRHISAPAFNSLRQHVLLYRGTVGLCTVTLGQWQSSDPRLSPVPHLAGSQRPSLRPCPGLQRRQRSRATQASQPGAQGSQRLLGEWKRRSGHVSRHWFSKRYLASPTLSNVRQGEKRAVWESTRVGDAGAVRYMMCNEWFVPQKLQHVHRSVFWKELYRVFNQLLFTFPSEERGGYETPPYHQRSVLTIVCLSLCICVCVVG